jgi:hypothetical protein
VVSAASTSIACDTPDVRRKLIAPLAAIALVAIAVFGRVVRGGFAFDDHWTIVRNRALTRSLAVVLRSALRGDGPAVGIPDATRPTMIASLWVDRNVFGLRAAAFHAHSLLLYVICAVLSYFVLRLFLRPRGATVGALLFAVAPIHAEVVAAIHYREDLLVAAPALAILWIVFSPRRFRAPEPRPVEIAAAATLLLMALMAKESAFAIGPLVLAIALARGDAVELLRSRRTLLLVLLAVFVSVFFWRISLGAGDDIPRAHPSLAQRVSATARYEVLAVANAFLPFVWMPEHAPRAPASMLWLVPFALLIGFCVVRRRSLLSVAVAIALVAPLASAPFVGPANEIADRYFFLAVLGGALAWGWVADRVHVAAPLSIVALGALSAISFRAAAAYRDDRTLWPIAVERCPQSPRAWTGLARVRRLDGDLSGADAAVAEALRLDPSYAPARLTAIYNAIARGDVAAGRAMLDALPVTSLPGLPRARTCAALAPDEARSCIMR